MFFGEEIRRAKARMRIVLFVAAVALLTSAAILEAKRGREAFIERASTADSVLVKLAERRVESALYGWFVWDETAAAVKNGDEKFLKTVFSDLKTVVGASGMSMARITDDSVETVFSTGNVFASAKKPLYTRVSGVLTGIFEVPVEGSLGEKTEYAALLFLDLSDLEEMFRSLMTGMPDFGNIEPVHSKDGMSEAVVSIMRGDFFVRVPSFFTFIMYSRRTTILVSVLFLTLAALASKLLSLLYRRSDMENKLSLLSQTLETRDGYSLGHTSRVAIYADILAEKLELSMFRRKKLRLACLCHDLGKLMVPVSVLDKPGALSPEERVIIERHPEAGRDILKGVVTDSLVEEIVLRHHERWDGGGYPDGLAGESIVREARILAVADTLDAITSERSYREARSAEEAYSTIESNAGTQFDPDIARLVRSVPIESPDVF